MKLYDLERRMRRFAISNLMTYIVAGMAAMFVLHMVVPGGVYSLFSLMRAPVLRGQIWRLITFIVLPPSTSVLWIVISLYFYWMIGSTLENQMGTVHFNLFYAVGVLGNIIAAMLTGYADNSYLNLSLFFAFAALNPNFQLMLFFFIPMPVKYLALLDAAFFLWQFITGSWATRAMIVLSLLNIILFFGGDLLNNIRRDSRYWKTRANFRRAMRK